MRRILASSLSDDDKKDPNAAWALIYTEILLAFSLYAVFILIISKIVLPSFEAAIQLCSETCITVILIITIIIIITALIVITKSFYITAVPSIVSPIL